MRRYINIAVFIVSVLTLASCSKENPFDKEWTEKGGFHTSALQMSLSNEESVVRSAATPDVKDFTVDFFKEGETTTVESFKYSEMPEVVTLPVGTYRIVAHYGDNAPAAWDAPYYKGESESFEIKNNEITDNVSPIVCKLSNVKVTILLDEDLKSVMSADSYIEVRVGNQGKLDYSIDDILNGNCGFFAHVAASRTLTATFHGKVEGYETHETKTYDNVAPGNHYRITFHFHSSDISDPGYINPGVRVDATVGVEDMNININPEDEILEDDMRPKEEGDEPTPPSGNGPMIEAVAPVSLDKVNDVTAGMTCVLNVTTEAAGGIQEFKVKIESETLTADLLKDVGLDSDLDLVNPGALEDGLRGLNFPVKQEVKGQKTVRFDISDFMPMLGIYGAATHRFTLEVTDANGTTKKTLVLRTF